MIEGLRVLVTGGSIGIGSAICRTLAAGGARVAVADIRSPNDATGNESDPRGLEYLWIPAEVAGSRMVLNATSLGLAGEHLPAACEALQRGQVAYKLVYGPETPFLAAARAAGAQAHGGLGMLVHQAAAAFARWSGVEAPTGVMRDALSK